MKIIRIIYRITLLTILSSIYFYTYADERKAIVKANVLQGETLSKINIDPKDVEAIIHDELQEMGIERVYSQKKSSENLLFIETFIYQFPKENPTVVLTVKTRNGIHYFNRDFAKVITNRKKAILNLVHKLANKMPDEFDFDKNYTPEIVDLISPTDVSLFSLINNPIMRAYRSKYSLSLNWRNISSPEFFIPQAFNDYLSYSVDFTGIREDLKSDELTIGLKLNDSGIFEIMDINSTVALNERQKLRVQRAIDAIPIWCSNGETYEADLILKIL